MPRGVVTKFETDRGFGFIRSVDYPTDIFVHISDLPGRVVLCPGQRVEFEVEHGDRGMRAVQVKVGRRGVSPTMATALGLGLVLGAVAYGLHSVGLTWVGGLFAGINAVTFGVYAWDKHEAGVQRRRVPEAVLLGLALLGGSPAAAVAMKLLRHKTRKPSFLGAFFTIIVLQVAAGLALWYRKM